MNVDDKRPAARPVWKLPLLVAALVVGVWQYWSWGPYTVTLEAEGTETKDFVVVCSYGMKWIESRAMVRRHVYITGHGQNVKCPRHFLGPFGIGMTARVYHPQYEEQSSHTDDKFMDGSVVLRPRALSGVMDELGIQAEQRQVLYRHMRMLEHNYLPEFDLSVRQVLADRYVEKLQQYTELYGGLYSANYDEKTLAYIDNLFRKPR